MHSFMLDFLKAINLPECIIANIGLLCLLFMMPKGVILCVGDSGRMGKYVLQGEQHWCVGWCVGVFYGWSLVL